MPQMALKYRLKAIFDVVRNRVRGVRIVSLEAYAQQLSVGRILLMPYVYDARWNRFHGVAREGQVYIDHVAGLCCELRLEECTALGQIHDEGVEPTRMEPLFYLDR